MLEKLLIENCAPTLANLKTASLFTVPVENPAEWQKALTRWRGILGGKGVSLEVLRDTGKTRLLYVYRESRLARDLSHGLARCILCGCGYAGFGVEEALDTLKDRIAREGDFPHEIGLFLGYPPEDVEGFMKHRGRNCKCVGCWKVYGDEEGAVRQFARFKKCRDVYLRLFHGGRSLWQLTVAS